MTEPIQKRPVRPIPPYVLQDDQPGSADRNRSRICAGNDFVDQFSGLSPDSLVVKIQGEERARFDDISREAHEGDTFAQAIQENVFG